MTLSTSWRQAAAKFCPPPSAQPFLRSSVVSMKWPTFVMLPSISGSRTQANSSTLLRRSIAGASQTLCSASCFRLNRRHRDRTKVQRNRPAPRVIMVAFKEEFPYLRCDSGQLFEFDRDWLHAAINRAADKAGYPSWWLTEHVTESIAFYLHLRNDENVVAFKQLQETVQYVLKAIGYKEIIPYFAPAPPPLSVSLVALAHHASRA